MTSLSSWSPSELRRHLLVETAIAITIATCLSALFTWLFFGGGQDVTLQTPKLIIDTFVQSFFVAFMIVLPNTLVVRRRLHVGKAPLHSPWGRWPRNAVLRGLLLAVPAALVLSLIHQAIAPVLPSGALSFGVLLAIKVVLGALIAVVAAPVAVRAALGDDMSARSGANSLFKRGPA